MNNPNVFGNKIWIAAVVFCVGITISQFPVFAAPQNNEKNETPFPLELQPPLVDNLQDAIDSYGNPITYSQPIETPDGRKVITAQGVQFEIPNYASGITEIKKPIQNLLPPFVEPTEQTTKPTSKFTFNKSDQGKVISNSVFQPVQLSTRPDPPISQPTPIGFTSSTLVPNLSPQSATTGTVFGGKYTGGFGGAPGFLGGQSRPGYAVQPDGSIRDPDHTVRPLGQVAAPSVNLQSRFDIPRVSNSQTTTTATGPKRVYTGSFGGPPGVLVPFDNVSVA